MSAGCRWCRGVGVTVRCDHPPIVPPLGAASVPLLPILRRALLALSCGTSVDADAGIVELNQHGRASSDELAAVIAALAAHKVTPIPVVAFTPSKMHAALRGEQQGEYVTFRHGHAFVTYRIAGGLVETVDCSDRGVFPPAIAQIVDAWCAERAAGTAHQAS